VNSVRELSGKGRDRVQCGKGKVAYSAPRSRHSAPPQHRCRDALSPTRCDAITGGISRSSYHDSLACALCSPSHIPRILHDHAYAHSSSSYNINIVAFGPRMSGEVYTINTAPFLDGDGLLFTVTTVVATAPVLCHHLETQVSPLGRIHDRCE
jgi:hypothetical protein